MKIRYLIIDDEPLAHRVLLRFASSVPSLELAGQCYDAFQAMEKLKQTKVDLIFLDIKMPGMEGLDMLRTLSRPPAVIVTSAYPEYALEGYELAVTDYLLKPFDQTRFLQAVNRISNDSGVAETGTGILSFKVGRSYYRLPAKSIHYLKGLGSYVRVFHEETPITAQGNLKQFSGQLGEAFLRIHKSFLVNKDHIERVDGNRLWVAGEELPIGATYRVFVYQILKLD